MKGQFMVISSILVGLIVISLASVISDVQTQEFDTLDTGYTVDVIKSEAADMDVEEVQDRRNFEQMLTKTGYETEMDYWTDENCLNVTLEDSSERIDLDCIG